MNHKTIVQFAVLCLQELDAQVGKTLSCHEISKRQGIPLPECAQVIQQLDHAGIVELAETGRVVLCRPVEMLTALDILEAV
jgi:DNA-binding IscR family transcriptional regulator